MTITVPLYGTPNPGSDEAVDQGCKCPIIDNRFGLGYYAGRDGEFVTVGDCPLHGEGVKCPRCGEPADGLFAGVHCDSCGWPGPNPFEELPFMCPQEGVECDEITKLQQKNERLHFKVGHYQQGAEIAQERIVELEKLAYALLTYVQSCNNAPRTTWRKSLVRWAHRAAVISLVVGEEDCYEQ